MRKISLGTCLAAMLLSARAIAQEDEAPPPLTDVWVVAPKDGMAQDFQDAVKEHMAFRAEKGDSRQWLTFTPVVGDKINIFMFRACCFDWADQDGYEAEDGEKGFGAHWSENVDQYVDHYHHYFDRIDWEHSYWPEEGTDGPYYGATTWVWKEDAPRAAIDARKEMSKLAKDGGWGEQRGPWLWLHQIGGKDTLGLVTPFSSYADMAPPEQSFYEFAVEKLGSEKKADAMFEKFSSGFASSDYTIWMYRENLSMPDGDE